MLIVSRCRPSGESVYFGLGMGVEEEIWGEKRALGAFYDIRVFGLIVFAGLCGAPKTQCV